MQDLLINVQEVVASAGAFAALLSNGRVITWGDPEKGGDSSGVQEQLQDGAEICHVIMFLFFQILNNIPNIPPKFC